MLWAASYPNQPKPTNSARAITHITGKAAGSRAAGRRFGLGPGPSGAADVPLEGRAADAQRRIQAQRSRTAELTWIRMIRQSMAAM